MRLRYTIYPEARQKLQQFKLALKKLKVSPKEAIMVGDFMVKDIEPAQKLGMKAFLAEYGLMKKVKGNPDFRLKRFKDLLSLV